MKVSVVIPTYNRSKKLIKTIKSVIENDFPKKEFEIIIIDDNSSDNTSLIVQSLKEKYKNIRYFKNEKNIGPAASRNKGIKFSKAEYIFFTDDDCIVPKNWIKTYVDFFEKNKNIYGIGGNLEPIKNNLIAKIEKFKDRILGINGKKIKIGKKNIYIGFTNNVAYRSKVFKKIGMFNEKFKAPAGEDVELKNRVIKKYDVAFIPLNVIHNQDYNLGYLINLIYKQGLEMMPPKKLLKKYLLFIVYFPILVKNIFKKILVYRKT